MGFYLLNTSADDDYDGADNHTHPSSKAIGGVRNSRGCGNTADVVDHENNARG